VAVTYLLATSVLTRLRHPAVRAALDEPAREGRCARPMICDLELGYTARNGSEWREIMAGLDGFALIDTTADHVRRALQVQRVLAERSQRGRKIPDLLVAAAAEQRGLTVLHYDADFDRITEVTGQPCQWVVPAGSVD
jgi:predicted nucleic acid-binding protein